jgi:chromosomal replication initiator protein
MLSPAVKVLPHPDDVIPAACAVLRLSEDEVKGRGRQSEIIDARVVAAHYLVRVLNLSFALAGRMMGGRDHSTILNSVRNHDKWIENNKPYREKYCAVVAHLEGGAK